MSPEPVTQVILHNAAPWQPQLLKQRVIRKTFQTRNPNLLWPAFQCYVIPIIMYASPSWSPSLAKNAEIIERVQRRFTKCLREMRNLSYKERINTLNALTSKTRRILADKVLTYKCLHDRLNCSPVEIGLAFSNFHCDNSHHRLYQCRAVNNTNEALFSFRAVTVEQIATQNHMF